MGGEGEAIESIACDVGATPWEHESEMAGKPRDARECRDMQKRAVSRPEPELSLQRDREGIEGWMTQSWVVVRVRRAAPQDRVVVTGEGRNG